MPRETPAAVRIVTWLIVAFVVFLIVSLGARRIWTADYWWQWKTGEYVSLHGAPTTDLFSYTRPDHERLELRWGYCLGLFRISETFGRGSAVVLKCLLLVITFVLAALTARPRGSPLTACAVVAVAALAASQRYYVRPEILTFLFFATFVCIIEHARRRRTRWIWLLPLVSAIWANVHGLFVLGTALVGAWFVAELVDGAIERLLRLEPDPDRGRRRVSSAALLGATLIASLLNPYFHRALLLPLLQFSALHGTAMKDFYAELRSPFAFDQSYTALFYYKLLIAICIGSLIVSRRRPATFRIIIVAAMFYLSATAIRNVPLFCLVAIPFVLGNLAAAPLWSRPMAVRLSTPVRALAALMLALFCGYQIQSLASNRFHLRQGDTNQFGVGLAQHRFPVRATEFLRTSGFEARMFNSSAAGSYLLAHGFPVFIDPRGEIYIDGIIQDYRRILSEPSSVPEFVEKYGFRLFFLESTMLPLIEYLHLRPDWRIVFADEVATIALHSDLAPEIPTVTFDAAWLAVTRALLPQPEPLAKRAWYVSRDSAHPYTTLGRLCFVVQAYAAARELLEDALALELRRFDSYDLLAFSTLELGDSAAAAGYYAAAIERDSENPRLRKQSAAAQFRLGHLERAAHDLDAFLADEAADAEALALRAVIAIRQNEYEAAAAFTARAIALAPRRSSYRFQHGQLMALLGRPAQAIASLEEAFRLDPSDVRAARDLARIHARQGERELARGWAERALRLAPENRELRELLGGLGGS